jgi:hypothetical protein
MRAENCFHGKPSASALSTRNKGARSRFELKWYRPRLWFNTTCPKDFSLVRPSTLLRRLHDGLDPNDNPTFRPSFSSQIDIHCVSDYMSRHALWIILPAVIPSRRSG